MHICGLLHIVWPDRASYGRLYIYFWMSSLNFFTKLNVHYSQVTALAEHEEAKSSKDSYIRSYVPH